MKRKFSMKWAASAAFFLCALFALLPTTAQAEEPVETVNIGVNGIVDCIHSGGTATCTEQAVCDNCGTKYGELNASNHASETYTNGFRDCCGDYQAAVLTTDKYDVDGDGNKDYVYEISNAGQLYWFAAKVNAGESSINGKLTANIDLNSDYTFTFVADTGLVKVTNGEDIVAYLGTGVKGDTSESNTVFDETAATAGAVYEDAGDTTADSVDLSSLRLWTPIGILNGYQGTFDGSNFTVSGLYFNGSGYAGLFASVNTVLDTVGKVQNVGVVNSYIKGKNEVGGVVGYIERGSITGCYNAGTVSGDTRVGGVAGNNYQGNVANCYNTGSVSGRSHVSGVTGVNDNSITNCYNTGTVSASENYVGGVVGQQNVSSGTVTNCYNTGAVTGNAYVGGVAGENNASITNCYNAGTVSGDTIVGGVAGNNYQGNVANCYNTGAVTGSGSAVGGVVGANNGTVEKCYYLADSETEDGGKTNAQFASGEVAYLLQSGVTAPEGETEIPEIWGQDITTGEGDAETDDYPVLGGAKVYFGYLSCAPDAEMVYTNTSVTAEKPAHGNITYANKGSNHTWTCGICGDSGEGDHVHIDNKACICGKKITPVVTAPEAVSNLTYTGAAQNLVTAGSTTGGTLKYSLDNTNWSAEIPTATNAGEYTVYCKVFGNDNYNDVDAAPVTVTIAQKQIYIDTAALADVVYNESGVYTLTVTGVTFKGVGDDNIVPLTLGTDYTATATQTDVSYGDLIKAVTASVEVTLKNSNYKLATTNVRTATANIMEHEHEWTYTADGDTITATCGNADTCPDAEQSITISAAGKTYDGDPVEATLTGSIEGVTTPTINYSGNINAGTYTASIIIEGKTASVEFIIAKADPTLTVPTAISGLIYNGSAQALITAGSTEHGTMQYRLDNTNWSAEIPTATNAGEYTVYYKVMGDGNHNDSASASVTVTVTPMNVSGAAVTLGTALTYTGTKQTQTVASVTLNGLTLTAGDYTVTGNQQTGAGDYTLTITGKGNFTGTATADWSIAKASMTITADNVTVLVGKTAPDVSALTYTVTGLVNGETADDALTKKPALSYAETPDTTQEGSYTINISGAEAANYTITYVTGTLTVSEKTAVTITVNIPANLVYDGTDQSDRIKANITAVDTATGEAVTVAGYEYQFSTDPINAGSYTLTVSVVDSDEQYVGSVNVSFTIAKRSLTLKADDKSAYVGDSEPEYTFTVTGLVTGHSASGAVADCAGADMTKAGTYSITVSAGDLVIKDGETDVTENYAITTANGTLTVSVPYTPPSSYDDYYYPSTPSTPSTENVTVPISGEDNTIHVDASVSGGKATVDEVDLDHLDEVIGDDADIGTVTIDFSGIDSKEPVTTVEIPVDVVKQITEASSETGSAAEHLEVVMSDGMSIQFDAAALSEKAAQTGGSDIAVSIEPIKDAKPTAAQSAAVKDRPAYDINVTSGGKHISDMGGKITVSAPYELRNGEKPGGLVVYYVDDHGNRERCETRYDEKTKRVSWKTDHLSLYMIDYDETLVEACDGGESCPVSAFSDADPGAWYHNGVHYCVQNGLMNGIGGGMFAPDGITTRSQLVTVLWRLEGQPVVNYLMQFEDVPAETWYTEAVRWAAAEKIVNGYGNGRFGSDDAITREQMTTILWRYAQYKGIDVSVGEDTNILSYTDAFSISEWAIPAMQWACGSGMIQGIADGDGMKLAPEGSASRTQIATILWRFCDTIMDN